MKKLLFTFSFVFLSILGLQAQEVGQINLNAGLALGTEAGINDDGESSLGLGVNLGGEYFITEIISFAPSYTYFFKDEIDGAGFSASIRLSALNFDGRYYFLTDDIQVYGLLGGSLLFGKFEQDIEIFGVRSRVEDTDSEFGLNIGGGVIYPLEDSFSVGGQVKYQTPGDGQLVLNVSLIYRLQ